MHFLLAMFLVVMGANFIYLLSQKLFNWITDWLPSLVFTIVKYLINLSTPNAVEPIPETDAQPEYKTLRRWHTGSLRHRLAEYHSHLEEGKGSKISQTLWKSYVKWVPDYYRSIDTESALNDPLPLWLEQLIRFFQNAHVKITIIALALLFIIVFTTHLWLPYISLYSITTQEELSLLLDKPIHECTNFSSSEPYCFLYNHEHLDEKRLMELTIKTPVFSGQSGLLALVEREPAPLLAHLHLLADERRSIYYPLVFRTPVISSSLSDFFSSSDEESVKGEWHTRYVRLEQELIPLLSYIHHEELNRGAIIQHPCICPLFLNIIANVSFLFDVSEQRWLVMAQPSIIRVNSFAEQVASTVASNERSLFYKSHRYWQRQMKDDGEMIHYDSFIVEYTEPSNELTLTEQSELSRFNKVMGEHDYTELRILSRQNEEMVQMQRKKAHVSGNDASCFIYCDTLQRLFYEKNKR